MPVLRLSEEPVAPVPQFKMETVEVIQLSPQERMSERMVERTAERTQTVDAAVPQRLEELQERISERMHEQTVDQPGDQACQDPADLPHRQGWQYDCYDVMTGPSVSDCTEDGETPAGAARERVHEQIVDVPVLHVALKERMHAQIVDVPLPKKN